MSLIKTNNIISLIGPMGSGKSCVGKSLSRRIKTDFADMDLLIENKVGMSISKIFEEHGENYFRHVEKEVLLEFLKNYDSESLRKCVISCGGGIVIDEDSRKRLKENTLSIWLNVSPERSIQRIKQGTRPLLDCEDPEEKVEKIFKERKLFYEYTAGMIIDTENLTIIEVVDNICKELDWKE
ncbi:MAG: shikimate kinase [Candidatus Delongbacteria bacterium]|nr:shikimate kinase [Candidatus Delongbacteria bacterium]